MRYILLPICILLFALYSDAQTLQATDTAKNVLAHADQMPVAGYDFGTYFANEYHCPDSAKCSGKVAFEFVVNEDGAISDCKMLKGLVSICDTEIFYIVKNMPAWKPGKINGRPVKVRYKFPFTAACGF